MKEAQQIIGIGTCTFEERRGAPRHKISLESSILISAVRNSTEMDEPYFVFRGQLLDVSISGLAMIISLEDMVELKKLGEDLILHLLLPLPAEAIELDAVPVRYRQLPESEKREVLVGAQITNMNGRDRVLFMQFIHERE